MRQPSDAEVLRAAMEAATKTVMTSLPGRVVSYDAATKRAVIEPMVHNGNPLPPIPDVPVKFPRGGGYRMVWPLNKGDEVTLHFHKWDPSRFRVGGEKSQTNMVRDAGIYPIAIPGSETETGTYSESTALSLGTDNANTEVLVVSVPSIITLRATTVNLTSGSPSDAAALASKVTTALNKLEAALTATADALLSMNSIAPNTGKADIEAALTGFSSAVASTKVKLE